MSRIAALTGLVGLLFVTFANAQTVGRGFAPNLGVWEPYVNEGILYGEPSAVLRIEPADPVRGVPIATRPTGPPPPVQRFARIAALAPNLLAPNLLIDPEEKPALSALGREGPVDNFLSRPHAADVPLPHPDLQGMLGPAPRSTAPRPYARGGDGGATVGLTLPIPADSSKSTRSGLGDYRSEDGTGSR